jgi:hypothetical protein
MTSATRKEVPFLRFAGFYSYSDTTNRQSEQPLYELKLDLSFYIKNCFTDTKIGIFFGMRTQNKIDFSKSKKITIFAPLFESPV